jgi:hypothetical protein
MLMQARIMKPAITKTVAGSVAMAARATPISVELRVKPVACKRPTDNWSAMPSSKLTMVTDTMVPVTINSKLSGTRMMRFASRASAAAPSSIKASSIASSKPISNTASNSVRKFFPERLSEVDALSAWKMAARKELAACEKL